MFVKGLPHASRRFTPVAVPATQTPIAVPLSIPRRRGGKTRILCVSSCTLVGGQEMVLKRLLRGLDKGLYDVECLITHDKGSLHDEYAQYTKLEYVSPSERDRLSSYILNKVKAGGYDVVHFFNLWSIYDVIPSLRLACPNTQIMVTLLADMHGHRASWGTSIDLIKQIRPHLSAFTTDSYVNQKVFPDLTVIRNGVPVELFTPGVKDPRLWVWVGRIINEKRPDRFVELAKRLPDYRFIMAGDGFPAVVERIRGNMPLNMELRPALSEAGVAELLGEATYLVFTSMTEGLPLAVLEGMSAGCIVVAEQVGDIPSVIADKQTGYLVPTGKVDTAEWIANVYKEFDPKVGEEARRVVLRDFHDDNMVKQYEHLYGEVGSHHSQTRIAFIWGLLPHHGYFWEAKTDSHQNTIVDLSKRNVVNVFVPTITDQPNSILQGQSYTYYQSDDHLDFVTQLRQFRPDMIFLNMFWDERWPIVLREFPGVWKALVSFGETRLKMPWADQVDLFISQQDFRAKLIAEVNGLPRDRVTTIPFCIEQWLFKPLPCEKVYTGIMVADFRDEVKRQHLLIEAWRDIPGKLVLVGPYIRSLPKNYHETCKALARKLGIEDRVIFMDGCPHADLPKLINKAKIGFLTSSHEGGSRSLLEQAACGLPNVVLSDCIGNVNRVRDGVDGVIAEPTPRDIAEKANKLLASNWVEMGATASEYARREYPYHRMSLDYKRVVEEASLNEVSIITTSKNRGKFLEDCIKSVQAQRGAKVNHLIMDGGSVDETPQILEKYKDVIHAYVDGAGGQTAAIIQGVDIIEKQFPRTKYLGWINADDFYAPSWLEDSLMALKWAPPNVAMVCGDATQVEEDGSFKQSLNYSNGSYMTLDQLCGRGNIIIQPTVLIRLDALRAIRAKTGMTWNPQYHYTQDLELWIRFLRNGYRVAKVGKVTANLRSHAGQMSLTHMDQQIVERDRQLRSVSVELGLPNPIWVRG
jgi:glycosyltransferase involved in cell wall biosynthesis/GT2 family glycosyltransferase